MGDWDIGRPLGECSGTGRQIQTGEEYYGALVETEQGLQRRDFSQEYWQQNEPSVYCHWKSVLPDADKKRKLFIDDEMLLSFFERLENEQEPEKLDFRFVLTLVLMRKRILKYLGSKIENGTEIWKVRIVPAKTEAQVINPNLGEDQIEHLREQMGQILHGELE